MNEESFALAEFNQIYEMLRNYINEQLSALRLFFTIYLAIWGGYILLLLNNLNSLVNFILIIGFLAGLLFLVYMSAIRFYFFISIRRLEFIRDKFLYKDHKWDDYPQFYPEKERYKNAKVENSKLFRLKSAFVIMILIISIANSILLCILDFGPCQTIMDKYILILFIFSLFCQVFFVLILLKVRLKHLEIKDASVKK